MCFDDYECVEDFLECVNYLDHGRRDGGGDIFDGLVCCSKISFEERKGETERGDIKTRLERRVVNWKTETFICCCHCHVGMMQELIAPLFGFKSASVVGDILHAWAAALNAVLLKWFPTTSRSQLLQACPERFTCAFGHAHTFMQLK
jgi:hypothetical protein